MKEVWQASTAPLDWHGKPVSPYLPWWWAAWIAASMVGNLSFKLSIKADSLDGFVTANIVNQTSEALSIILCAIFVKIVKEIHAMQSSNPMVQRVFE
jgi:hypothetical protein